jgi:hypothetical protein
MRKEKQRTLVARLDQLRPGQIVEWEWSKAALECVRGIRPIGRVVVRDQLEILCLDSDYMVMSPARMLEIGKAFYITSEQ